MQEGKRKVSDYENKRKQTDYLLEWLFAGEIGLSIVESNRNNLDVAEVRLENTQAIYDTRLHKILILFHL
jgi:hypothetical protein